MAKKALAENLWEIRQHEPREICPGGKSLRNLPQREIHEFVSTVEKYWVYSPRLGILGSVNLNGRVIGGLHLYIIHVLLSLKVESRCLFPDL